MTLLVSMISPVFVKILPKLIRKGPYKESLLPLRRTPLLILMLPLANMFSKDQKSLKTILSHFGKMLELLLR
jgi:hypothetical protein